MALLASFVTVGKAAIVRQDASPYETVRDASGELAGQSTITEEELVQVLKENGVTHSHTSRRQPTIL